MLKKSPEKFLLAGSSTNPLRSVFCPPEGQKLPNHDENSGQDTHYINVCTKSEASI